MCAFPRYNASHDNTPCGTSAGSISRLLVLPNSLRVSFCGDLLNHGSRCLFASGLVIWELGSLSGHRAYINGLSRYFSQSQKQAQSRSSACSTDADGLQQKDPQCSADSPPNHTYDITPAPPCTTPFAKKSPFLCHRHGSGSATGPPFATLGGMPVTHPPPAAALAVQRCPHSPPSPLAVRGQGRRVSPIRDLSGRRQPLSPYIGCEDGVFVGR